eukprot:scaffold406_cov391-Prasinococcus_capsulatus_cf.AAC.17
MYRARVPPPGSGPGRSRFFPPRKRPGVPRPAPPAAFRAPAGSRMRPSGACDPGPARPGPSSDTTPHGMCVPCARGCGRRRCCSRAVAVVVVGGGGSAALAPRRREQHAPLAGGRGERAPARPAWSRAGAGRGAAPLSAQSRGTRSARPPQQTLQPEPLSAGKAAGRGQHGGLTAIVRLRDQLWGRAQPHVQVRRARPSSKGTLACPPTSRCSLAQSMPVRSDTYRFDILAPTVTASQQDTSAKLSELLKSFSIADGEQKPSVSTFPSEVQHLVLDCLSRPRDLFAAALACPEWRSTILGSPLLVHKMVCRRCSPATPVWRRPRYQLARFD